MLTFNGNLKVYVSLQPCDMRKSFQGLTAIVRDVLRLDPLSGAAFLFSNRRRNLIKILYWDRGGWWLVAKRLERGTYSWPRPEEGRDGKLRLAPVALAMLTGGIDLRDGVRRAWYDLD